MFMNPQYSTANSTIPSLFVVHGKYAALSVSLVLNFFNARFLLFHSKITLSCGVIHNFKTPFL